MVLFWRCGWLGRVAVQRTPGATLVLVFLLWRGFLPGALPPWRRPSRRARFVLRGGVLWADIGPRLQRKGGLGRGAERIGLPHQFRQRIALAAHIRIRTAIMVGVGRKRSVLITISHREDCIRFGAAPTRHDHRAMTNELAPARHPHNPHCEGLRPCLPHLGWRASAENG